MKSYKDFKKNLVWFGGYLRTTGHQQDSLFSGICLLLGEKRESQCFPCEAFEWAKMVGGREGCRITLVACR